MGPFVNSVYNIPNNCHNITHSSTRTALLEQRRSLRRLEKPMMYCLTRRKNRSLTNMGRTD